MVVVVAVMVVVVDVASASHTVWLMILVTKAALDKSLKLPSSVY